VDPADPLDRGVTLEILLQLVGLFFDPLIKSRSVVEMLKRNFYIHVTCLKKINKTDTLASIDVLFS
jgi:hypothetical protein